MREIVGAERDSLIVDILQRIERDTQKIGAPERIEAWREGWANALSMYRRTGSLVPQFIKLGQPVRYKQKFCHPAQANHEELYCRRLQQEFLYHWLRDCDNIYEFGCGTGFNLNALRYLLPNRGLFGFDFVQPAVDLVREIGLKADILDMRNPGPHVMPKDSGVFTFGSIEQLVDFKPFLEWLIAQRPKIVCHVEPIPELLDERNLVDYLSLMFSRKRGYTTGFLPWLQQDQRIELLHVRRSYFGSLMMESYAEVAWKLK